MSYNNENGLKNHISEIFCLAESERVTTLDSESAIGYYLSFLFEPMKAGYAFAVFLDKKHRVVSTVKLKKAGVMASSTVSEAITNALKDKRIVSFIIAHNHYGNPTTPSFEDMATTNLLYRKFNGTKVNFLGHYVVSDFDYTVITDKGHVKHPY